MVYLSLFYRVCRILLHVQLNLFTAKSRVVATSGYKTLKDPRQSSNKAKIRAKKRLESLGSFQHDLTKLDKSWELRLEESHELLTHPKCGFN